MASADCNEETLKSEGTGTCSASASATVNADALPKRSAGFLAMQRIITADNSGDMFGLMIAGSVGMVLTCCIIIADIVSPRKGGEPVHIS